MAATSRLNKELQDKSKKALLNCKEPVERLRLQCLARGANGIKGLGRTFKIMDDDQSRSLDIKELRKGIHDYGVVMENNEVDEVFQKIDVDGSGQLDFDEFLKALRPPMNNGRKGLIRKAFQKLDKSGDNVVTVEDLKGVYSGTKHKKFLSGEWTEDECLKEFLDSFDSPGDKDGQITEEEFINYYSGVSASVDSDAYFDLMMRNAWKL